MICILCSKTKFLIILYPKESMSAILNFFFQFSKLNLVFSYELFCNDFASIFYIATSKNIAPKYQRIFKCSQERVKNVSFFKSTRNASLDKVPETCYPRFPLISKVIIDRGAPVAANWRAHRGNLTMGESCTSKLLSADRPSWQGRRCTSFAMYEGMTMNTTNLSQTCPEL